ncbi:H/ACA ribonucleoprotein complex subunit GAR1-like [Papaver somniferum]|uniref:H/ACA ribonucleoprotein complex subunit GAR1-like n=1 Tax=Papaver somniferum TaxID=3469 RepID=UPI000E704DA8|nr:H/ACA ribonucleoprotein complex subunit GAR1-like [Papaver somniferum]
MAVERVNWVSKDITRMIDSREQLTVPELRLLRNQVQGIILPEKVGLYPQEDDRSRRNKRARSPSSRDDSDTPSREQAPSKQGKGGKKGGRAGTSARGGSSARGGKKEGRGGTSAARGGRGGGKKAPTQAGKGKGGKGGKKARVVEPIV